MGLVLAELFAVAEKRLAWASTRQTLLARNVANLSTAGYKATDVPDFRRLLAGADPIGVTNVTRNHIPIPAGHIVVTPALKATASTVDGNGVRLEEQLMKVADTETINSVVSTIFKKYISMFNVALGKVS